MTSSGPLIILGVDPGLASTGYGVIIAEGSRHRCLAMGEISPPREASRAEKLIRICEGLGDVIRDAGPGEVAVEDFVLGHTRAAVAIAEARAAAVLAAASAGLPVALYKPSEVKKFVTSYGRGSKEQVSSMVQALLGLSESPSSPDAADALAVAVCHALRRESMVVIGGASR